MTNLVSQLREALQDLCDEQNGPPLERRREEWQRAYDRARVLLRDSSVEPRERRPMTLDDAGYAPGGYIIKCRDCDTQTWDCDKRAIRCEPCAMRLLAAENRRGEHE